MTVDDQIEYGDATRAWLVRAVDTTRPADAAGRYPEIGRTHVRAFDEDVAHAMGREVLEDRLGRRRGWTCVVEPATPADLGMQPLENAR